MNNIYRVIYNKSTQTFQAVCEFARAQGKGSTTTVGSGEAPSAVGRLIRFTLIMSGMILSAQAVAATGTEYQAGTDNVCYFDTATNSVVCGNATTQVTDQGKNAVSVGIGAEARNNNDIAIGQEAGNGLKDRGTNFDPATTIFKKDGVDAPNAESIVTHSNISIGKQSGKDSTGIDMINLGSFAGQNLNSAGSSMISIGKNANKFKTLTKVEKSVAIGHGATTEGSSSVAIGDGAINQGYKSVVMGPGAKIERNASGITPVDSVVFGASAYSNQSNDVVIGRGAGTRTTGAGGNVILGSGSGTSSDIQQNVIIGTDAGHNVNFTTPDNRGVVSDLNIFIGQATGQNVNGRANIAIGEKNAQYVGKVNRASIMKEAIETPQANNSTQFTIQEGQVFDTDRRSDYNFAIGARSGSNVLGGGNYTIGGGSYVVGTGNLSFGDGSGSYISGSNNISIGAGAGVENLYEQNGKLRTHYEALSKRQGSISIGLYSKGVANRAIAIGTGIDHNTPAARATATDSLAIGTDSVATGVNATSIGKAAIATGKNAVAIGSSTPNTYEYFDRATGRLQDLADNSHEHAGRATRANAENAVAIGNTSQANAINSLAIGTGAKATGTQSISIGTGNVVSGNNSGALGDPSIVSGAGSYTVGNDNAVGSTSTNVGAFGNNNQIGATATYDAAGKLQLADGLTDTAAVSGSRVVGNNNTITTNETFVLGNRVTTTADNSVFLGTESGLHCQRR
ncbi:hypothetical protein LU290_02685 [Moraxella nasibovis]|uniref:ESPR-type extended signal peptide-containing protein n=1 Tax=Moraxella nasibovis TaxID=2904120 RepID=UPI00240E9D16|nr:ESPR-type extended signal peptide-containing protein [Moraxella nasibovis]WFF39151.1 hypothetical protein LU290_02685 [Moraxella nasibovis]